MTWLWALISVFGPAAVVLWLLTVHERRSRRRPTVDCARVAELEPPPKWDVELAQLDYKERREYFGGVQVYVHDAMHQRSRLTVTGNGARVEIGGTVADGARVTVIGNGATITVNGRIDAGTRVTATGAGARVIAHGPVHRSARVTPAPGR